MTVFCDFRFLLIISSAARYSVHFVDFQPSISWDHLVPPRDWRALLIHQSLAVKTECKRFVITSQWYHENVLVITRSTAIWVGGKVEAGIDDPRAYGPAQALTVRSPTYRKSIRTMQCSFAINVTRACPESVYYKTYFGSLFLQKSR